MKTSKKKVGRPKLDINAGSCLHCDEPAHCRGLCLKHYRKLHYVENERARRGAIAMDVLPVGSTGFNTGGYIIEKNDTGHGARDWVLQHRLVMSRAIGRPLDELETVHHKNGDKIDNRLENLELWSSRHPSGQRVEDLIQFAHDIFSRYGEGSNGSIR